MYGQSPPTWQIFAVIGLLALPSSAIVGVLAAWLWQHFAKRVRVAQ